MPLQAMPAPTTHLDVRQLPTHERHALIFSVFRRLGPSDSMVITNDHDPWPLHAQLQAAQAGRFGWSDLERGPEVWRVRIVKSAIDDRQVTGGGCCGGCGGA